MRLLKFALLVVAGCSIAFGQTCGLPAGLPVQIFDNNGQPASGALVGTFLAGTSTPAPSYTSSSCLSPNANPAVADASGRVYVWIPVGTLYKAVVQTSSSVTLFTLDNLSSSSSSGGPTTNFWTLFGSEIRNNNGAGAGNVSVGAAFSAAGNITVGGTLQLSDSATHYAVIRAANAMAATVTWTWPGVDAVGCLSSNGSGVLSFAACGSGGSGAPAGPTTAIQTNGGAGLFAGDANFAYTGGATPIVQLLGSGYISSAGGFVTASTATNAIQAPTGGILGLTLRTTDSVIWVEESAPVVSAAGQARMYDDATAHNVLLSVNAGAYAPLATTAGVLTNGHCVSINGSGNLVDAGGACTTGGGGGTVSSQNQYRVGYYTSAGISNTIGGDANFVFNGATQQLTVTGTSTAVAGITVNSGFVQADGGFNATGSATNIIQALTGGVAGKWLTASDSLFLIEETAPALSAAGQARIYADSSSHTLKVSQNNGAYATLGGGGGSCPGGSNTAIQFNNSGICGGTAASGANSMVWDGTKILVTTSGVAAGMFVSAGYMQSDSGFLATSGTCNSYNCLQAPTGGVFARSLRGTKYTGIGNNSGVPTATTGDSSFPVAGDMYCDTATSPCTQKFYGGAAWISLATGGVSSLNSLTGALSIVGTSNEIIVTPAGTNVTISTPQAIATSSSPTFANVTAAASFGSNNTSAGVCSFENNNVSFCVGGTGVVNANSYQVGGTAFITSARNLTNVNQIDLISGGISQLQINFTGAGGRLVVNNTAGTITTSLGATTGVQTTVGLQTYTAGFGSLQNNIGSAGISSTVGFTANGNVGVTCSGAPTSSFASVLGIVTHC